MSVFLQPGAKRKIYWYRFMRDGQVIRRSTKQSNYKVAVNMESAHQTALAKNAADIFEKTPAPTLAVFAKEFLAWAKTEFAAKPKTYAYYQNSIDRLGEHPPLASMPLDSPRIGEILSGYKAKRQADGLAISSLNHELRAVRRLLHLAVEWGRIASAPKVKLLAGEMHREHVVSPEEEQKYLAAAPPLLADIATIMFDSGHRPEELFRQRWENVTWVNGRHGTIFVSHGKTKATRRVLPLTPRVRAILDRRWEAAGKPEEGWIFLAPTASGHAEPSTIKKQHRKALRFSGVRQFVIYSARHTFLTRLGASGCDVWTLARIAGHSSIAMSMRYVHPSGDAVLRAMERGPDCFVPSLGGQDFGHSAKTEKEEKQLSA